MSVNLVEPTSWAIEFISLHLVSSKAPLGDFHTEFTSIALDNFFVIFIIIIVIIYLLALLALVSCGALALWCSLQHLEQYPCQAGLP